MIASLAHAFVSMPANLVTDWDEFCGTVRARKSFAHAYYREEHDQKGREWQRGFKSLPEVTFFHNTGASDGPTGYGRCSTFHRQSKEDRRSAYRELNATSGAPDSIDKVSWLDNEYVTGELVEYAFGSVPDEDTLEP